MRPACDPLLTGRTGTPAAISVVCTHAGRNCRPPESVEGSPANGLPGIWLRRPISLGWGSEVAAPRIRSRRSPMRSDIAPGAAFPDYELSDHMAKRRKLSELQGQHPMVVVLSR